MAHYTPLSAEQLSSALARFGLPPPSQVRPEPRGAVNTGYHVWSGGRRLFLRVKEGASQADAGFEAEVQQYLHAARFPVPELLAADDGRAWIEVSGKPTMLFAYAPGEEIAPGDVTPERCRRVGEQLGRLHELGAGFGPTRPNPYGRDWVASRLGELEARVSGEAALALPLFRDALERSARLPGAPRGLIHGDLFGDNVLWIGDRVSALLDWEMSCVDPFAYDLAVALDAWCFDASGELKAERGQALLAGYRARRRLEPETAAALWEWSCFAALRFAVARLAGYAPPGAAAPPPPGKDWREYRDRLTALRGMGEGAFLALLTARS